MTVNLLIFAAVFLGPPLLTHPARLLHPAPWMGVVFAVVTLATQPSLSARTMVTDARDRLSALAILVSIVVSQLVAVLEFSLRGALFPAPGSCWVIGGFSIGVMGLALRLWAIHTLGSYFTSTVQVQGGQPVLSTGPFRLIRHPSYAGTLLTVLGIALALGSVPGALLVVVAILPAYLYRIRVEERELLAGLGDEYARYRERTWALVPFVM